MARKKQIEEENIVENISIEPLEDVMSDRYAIYAKEVIQDRAIPDVRDGLKPVQRRILYSMFKEGNTINKPTRKCAHTVGAVMGKYHPHGDSSIYDAMARLSQDWKIRMPLVDFQGNNGSIDGDSPAAYRYTEARLSELSNQMLLDIDKNTVDMQLTFDDTDFEPTVLPSRFPNLFVNGSGGIAVALATEIPSHNLNELVEATVYRIQHPNCSYEDLMEFVPGPDFPTGGIIYNSDGLKNMYSTGKGRIEIAARTQVVESSQINQIIITEIPYKVVKTSLVYEIDKIRHGKKIDGIIEVRDESDFSGIRIVIDLKKNAPIDLILSYLMKKTQMCVSYTANIVAIVDGRPKTLTLPDYLDAYIAHQVSVVTRKSQFDLDKYSARLHIVEGLITASLNITEVVQIIRSSKDKADSKVNLISRFNFSNEQAEAIVMMPLYKLSHTDEEILQKEKTELEGLILELKEILDDPVKLNKVIIKDLRYIAKTYGDERRTSFEDKEETGPIDKRFLISKEKVYFSVTRDGYLKRSSNKSYISTLLTALYPEIKDGDVLVAVDTAWTTDFLIVFTNFGNYMYIPVYKLDDLKWRDKGNHISSLINVAPNEKIIRVICATELRNDLFAIFLTKNGQIKRSPLSEFVAVMKSRPVKCIRLGKEDELIDVKISTGNANIMVFSDGGYCSTYNENELIPLSLRASGVKSMSLRGGQKAVGLLIAQEEEKSKIVLITDKSCLRIFDTSKANITARLAKTQVIFKSFKSDAHHLIYVEKARLNEEDKMPLVMYNQDFQAIEYNVEDFHLTDIEKYAKKNIDEVLVKDRLQAIFTPGVEIVDDTIVSQPITVKTSNSLNEETAASLEDEEDKEGAEQLSLLDDLD